MKEQLQEQLETSKNLSDLNCQGEELKIKLILEKIYNQFERKININDEAFYCLKDNTSELMQDDFRDLIHGIEFMPDNYRYETAYSIIGNLLEYSFNDLDDIRDIEPEICDSLISIYNHHLTNWLSSNLKRQRFCNEALELELGNSRDINSILQAGQYLEAQEIFNGVLAYLEKNLD